MAPASDNHGSASASRWRCSSASRHPIAQLGEAERLYGEEWSCQRLAERLTVKSGHVSGWPSATDVMTRRCGSAKATQSAGAETVGTNLNIFWDNLSQSVTTCYILGD
jgi:hypothetical protein